ncbi:MAG: hypothetical protein M0R73_09445 [Dehalococcoidia bacterium]|nr:hypothetical protein [Dehalococcoidia bacterium]
MFRKTRPTARVGALALGAFAALALVACGGGDSNNDATAAPTQAAGGDATTVQVTLGAPSELELEAAPASVPAGAVTFEVENAGALLHELVVIKSDQAVADLPAANAAADLSALDVAGDATDIQPGASDTLKVDLEAGTYILLCNIPGHYMSMNTTFTVE